MRHLPVALRRRAALPAAIFAVLAAGFAASAATYLATSLRQLTHSAVAVAEIEVTQKDYPELLPGQTFPRTHVSAKVVRALKGALPETIVIDIPGGIHNGIASYVPDGPDFANGERALVFLKQPAGIGERFMIQDLGLGKFNLVERGGKKYVESPLCPHALASRPGNQAHPGNLGNLEAELLTRSIPYDVFCDLVSAYASGKEPSRDVIGLAAGLPAATAHRHQAVPAVVADAIQQHEEAGQRNALWALAAALFICAGLALIWVRQRRRKGAPPLKAHGIVLLLGVGLLAGAGAGAVCHAFVPFDQNTVWNLDKPLNGKVAGNRIIWKQSTAVSKTNPNVFSSVQASFDQWEAVASSRLAFTAGGSTGTVVNDSSDAENVIAWTSTPSNDFSASTLAITFSSFSVGTGSSFLDGDIIFNDRDFNWGAGGDGNALSVSLHEIGHFVGLNHTTDKNTVMFPFDQGFSALKPDEILAAQTLYPGAAGATPAPAPAGGPIVTASGSPTSGLPPLAVGFTGVATPGSSGNPVAALAWSFGDGNSASGANVVNTYTSSGTFTATLTATDSGGLTGTATVKVNVGELADATKAAFRLNFSKLGKDSFSMTLASDQLLGFKDARGSGSTTQGYVNIGDQSWQFEYNTEKGRSANRDGPRISVNDRKGTVSISIRNADLRDVLGGHGAINTDISGATVTVPVVVWFGDAKNTFIFARIQFSYTAKADKTGSGKF